MKWIPAADRKPEPFEHVLVYSESEGIMIGYYKDQDTVVVNPFDGSNFNNITHWMPLPNKPS